MTTPITGPFNKVGFLNDIPHWADGSTGNKAYRLTRTWYRQAKPYDLPLDFDSVTRYGTSRYNSSGPYGTFSGSNRDASVIGLPDTVEIYAEVYNQAYARFVAKMGEAVELGVATAEGRQAMSMVTRRLMQMANFTRHVATGKLGLAAGDLGLELTPRVNRILRERKAYESRKRYSPSKDSRETVRGFASTFLEFHFGWSPLVKDIHDGLKVLENPLKPQRVSASATGTRKDPLSFTSSSQDVDWNYASGRVGSTTQTIRLQGDLVIVNANLALTQQMGLANPASIAWELVPFSFVLDWFVNVGDCLSSLTDFAGVQFLKPQRTVFSRYTGNGYDNKVAKKPTQVNTVTETWTNRSYHVNRRRTLGTGPILKLRSPKPWPVARGLAAASLLMQRFPEQVIDQNALTLARKRTSFRQNHFPKQFGQYV